MIKFEFKEWLDHEIFIGAFMDDKNNEYIVYARKVDPINVMVTGDVFEWKKGYYYSPMDKCCFKSNRMDKRSYLVVDFDDFTNDKVRLLFTAHTGEA